MDEKRLPTPHNNFFHYSFSQLPTVRSLIETRFSPEITQELDLDTLALEKDTFIDPQLRESYSDLLYSVQLKNQRMDVGQALVYFLFEHKSEAEALTAFQMLRYIVRIWEQRLRNNRPLCPIIPLVVYHGETAWSAPRRIEDLVASPEAFREFSVQFGFPLLDLSQTSDDELVGEPFLQSVLRLLKYGRSSKLKMELEAIFQFVKQLGLGHLLQDHLEAVLVYIMAANKTVQIEDLRSTLDNIFPTQILPGTIADRLRQEGRQQGLLIGKIQLLQELLDLDVASHESFYERTIDELKTMVAELQAQLGDRDRK